MTTSQENMQKVDAQEAKQVDEKGIENSERLSGAKNTPKRYDEENKRTNNRASVELTINRLSINRSELSQVHSVKFANSVNSH